MLVIDGLLLNRLGMGFNVLALILATPEIYGERPLRVANAITVSLLRLFLGFALTVLNVRSFQEVAKDLPDLWRLFKKALVPRKFLGILLALIPIVIILGSIAWLLFIETTSQKIVTVVGFIMLGLIVWLVPKWLVVLADSSSLRKFWLRVGGGLFLLGSILQFISTFIT